MQPCISNSYLIRKGCYLSGISGAHHLDSKTDPGHRSELSHSAVQPRHQKPSTHKSFFFRMRMKTHLFWWNNNLFLCLRWVLYRFFNLSYKYVTVNFSYFSFAPLIYFCLNIKVSNACFYWTIVYFYHAGFFLARTSTCKTCSCYTLRERGKRAFSYSLKNVYHLLVCKSWFYVLHDDLVDGHCIISSVSN